MAKTIYKYNLSVFADNDFDMPKGTTPLHVDNQQDHLCLWAEVDTDLPKQRRSFVIVGTGHEIPPDAQYVGTAQVDPFVWHVFEVNK